MAAIRLYRPDLQAFVSQTIPTSGLPLAEVLLLNILVELKLANELAAQDAPVFSDPDQMRTDLVNDLFRTL